MIQAYLQDLLDIAVRRKWLIMSIVLISVTVSGLYAWYKPLVYRSSTTILVEHQKIPGNIVRPMVSDGVAERVTTITQQVLSRSNLQKVIEELNLYPEAIKEQGYDTVIAELAANVELETKGSRGRLESFTISFSHGDPMTAMKVTAKLASQYIDQNLKIREQFVEGASEFLDQELEIARKELDEKEKILSEYKLRHYGKLPGQLTTNLRSLDRLQRERVSIQESLNSLNTRIEVIQKSMRDYESMAGTLGDMQGIDYGAGQAGPAADPLAKRLATMKEELKKMLVEYTESYPDVISLRNHIKRLEAEMEERGAIDQNLEEFDTGEILGEGLGESSPRFDPYLQDLTNTQSELKSEIASLKERDKRIVKEMDDYQRNIEATPQHEQELLVLERDYRNMQKNYQRLHEKQLNSRISENLEKRQKAERFRILDPANLPTIPEGPPQYLIVLAGFFAGCGIGYGLAFLLEQWKPTFRRSEDAEVSIGLPILATIPSFQIAYGKSFKSLSHSSPSLSHMNRPGRGDNSYLPESFPDKRTNGKTAYQSKNGFPQELGLVARWRPGSIVAEQFRVAATRLNLMHSSQESTVVLVTSSMKGEGKTSTVANLAYTLANDLNEPTLVIDCDFKRPAMHELMSIPSEPGLAEYFQGEETIRGLYASSFGRSSLGIDCRGYQGKPCAFIEVSSAGIDY